MHCLLQMSQDSWSWRGPLGIVSSGTLMWRQLRVHTAAEEDGRRRLRCCSVPRMQQVSVAGPGPGLASHAAVPLLSLHTHPPRHDSLSRLGRGLERLQRRAGCCGGAHTQRRLSSRPRGGFLKVSHRACSFDTQRCWDAASLCPSCRTSVAVQSFLLHPSPVPDVGLGDTEGVRRGGGQ